MKFLFCMLLSVILFVVTAKASDSSDTETDSSEGRSGKYKNYLQRKWNLSDIQIQNRLDDIVHEDCQILYQSGNSKSIRDVYVTMTLTQAESTKRKVNDGYLPLNPPA